MREAPARPLENELPAPSASLPTDIARQSQREMDRLRRLPQGSIEASLVRGLKSFLEGVDRF